MDIWPWVPQSAGQRLAKGPKRWPSVDRAGGHHPWGQKMAEAAQGGEQPGVAGHVMN
jgi:hypothetical protein